MWRLAHKRSIRGEKVKNKEGINGRNCSVALLAIRVYLSASLHTAAVARPIQPACEITATAAPRQSKLLDGDLDRRLQCVGKEPSNFQTAECEHFTTGKHWR
jgi:hypothetical protein